MCLQPNDQSGKTLRNYNNVFFENCACEQGGSETKGTSSSRSDSNGQSTFFPFEIVILKDGDSQTVKKCEETVARYPGINECEGGLRSN